MTTPATPREKRLRREFERMKALLQPHSLFRFWCADLSDAEAKAFLHTQITFDVIEKGLPGFLEPDEFERKHPGTPPEKYLVIYGCTGLMRKPDGEIAETAMHAMEVIFGWDYPSKAPTFIWHTPIWHPNFNPPHICIQGRPFAIGLTLDTIVLEVGRMIQYQNYNVDDAMNHEAEDWARHNPRRFPVDDRDLLDGRVKLSARRKASLEDELVQIVVPDKVDMKSDQLIELTGIHFDASQLKHKPN